MDRINEMPKMVQGFVTPVVWPLYGLVVVVKSGSAAG
jgi:hypothetical protein